MKDLAATIGALFAEGPSAERAAARQAFFALQAALDRGDVRAAEPDAATATGWRVNA